MLLGVMDATTVNRNRTSRVNWWVTMVTGGVGRRKIQGDRGKGNAAWDHDASDAHGRGKTRRGEVVTSDNLTRA